MSLRIVCAAGGHKTFCYDTHVQMSIDTFHFTLGPLSLEIFRDVIMRKKVLMG